MAPLVALFLLWLARSRYIPIVGQTMHLMIPDVPQADKRS